MSDAVYEAQSDAMRRALAILGEHFDAVQILATVTDDEGGTRLREFGRGNYYARKGMVMEYVEHAQAEEIARQIKAKESE